MSTAAFEIKLPQFEGPFDLLLFFIERDELDIHDIPISTITNDFLDYIHQLESLNIEVASEFILVAATLMRIKAKMLLPRKELDEEGEEIDPREELVQRLLEYKRYKEVCKALEEMEAERMKLAQRGNTSRELKTLSEKFSVESELQSLTMFGLMKAFQKVLTRMKEESEKPRHTIKKYPYTLKDEKRKLRARLKSVEKLSFEEVFEVCSERMHAVFLFLSMLEMIQEHLIRLKLGEGRNNFWLSAAETA